MLRPTDFDGPSIFLHPSIHLSIPSCTSLRATAIMAIPFLVAYIARKDAQAGKRHQPPNMCNSFSSVISVILSSSIHLPTLRGHNLFKVLHCLHAREEMTSLAVISHLLHAFGCWQGQKRIANSPVKASLVYPEFLIRLHDELQYDWTFCRNHL